MDAKVCFHLLLSVPTRLPSLRPSLAATRLRLDLALGSNLPPLTATPSRSRNALCAPFAYVTRTRRPSFLPVRLFISATNQRPHCRLLRKWLAQRPMAQSVLCSPM